MNLLSAFRTKFFTYFLSDTPLASLFIILLSLNSPKSDLSEEILKLSILPLAVPLSFLY